MKYRFLVSDSGQLEKFQKFLEQIQPAMDTFEAFLRKNYAVRNLPRVVILTDRETATQLISDLPIPAYTNDLRTVFCPEIAAWRDLYLRQLETDGEEEIRQYYKTQLSMGNVLQILGHEFVHHSEFFLEEAYDRGIWFEEGMCEYISRKFFLTEAEFERAAQISALLVERYESQHGVVSLEAFGAETYQKDLAGIFCCYWKSFLTIVSLIQRCDGDEFAVFRQYRQWSQAGYPGTLEQWFGM